MWGKAHAPQPLTHPSTTLPINFFSSPIATSIITAGFCLLELRYQYLKESYTPWAPPEPVRSEPSVHCRHAYLMISDVQELGMQKRKEIKESSNIVPPIQPLEFTDCRRRTDGKESRTHKDAIVLAQAKIAAKGDSGIRPPAQTCLRIPQNIQQKSGARLYRS